MRSREEELEYVRKTLATLGFDEKTVKRVLREIRVPISIKVVEDDIVETNPECGCSASLVSYSSGYTVITGKAEIVERLEDWCQCGPDVWVTERHKIRLQPGTIVFNYVTGYTGNRREDYFELIVRPPQ